MEQQIEDTIEEYVPVDRAEFEKIAKLMAEYKAAYKKDKVISIRLNSLDIEAIKNKAKKHGIKYQTLISEILHRAATA